MSVAMTEKAWQDQILDIARLSGWLAYHTFDSRRSAAGFPDLVLVRGRELIFVELKTDHGKTSPAQDVWLDALGEVAAGVTDLEAVAVAVTDEPPALEVYVWRPSQFTEVFDRLRRRPA